jgi:RimJ/RimL family protein N-acetyltransferase
VILAGQRERVRDYICSRIRDIYARPEQDYEAIGVVGRGGELIGGVMYTNYHEIAPGEHDVWLTAAGEPGWLTRGNIRVLIGYPFIQLKCIRLTSVIAKANSEARSLNERLGFQLEGKIRNGRGTGKHCLVYGLLKADAEKWIS